MSLFLYGDVADNFASTSAPFVEASGGRSARIGLLLQGGDNWQKYLPRYRDPWLNLGVAEVVPIVPNAEGRVNTEALDQLRSCTGVFVAGGDTALYHHAFVASPVGDLVRSLYRCGVPYGGVSAGAKLAAAICVLRGERVTTPANQYALRAGVRTSQDLADEGQIVIAEGLGLLDGSVIETHITERGLFPRLVAGIEFGGVAHGLGIDEPLCLEARTGGHLRVWGRGMGYLVRRTGPSDYSLRLLAPGDTVTL